MSSVNHTTSICLLSIGAEGIYICICSNRTTFYRAVFDFRDDESLVSVAKFCCIENQDLYLHLHLAFLKHLIDVRKIVEQEEGHR